MICEKLEVRGFSPQCEADLRGRVHRVLVRVSPQQDAHAMRKSLDERVNKFGLKLHPEKTRVIRFGRYARGRNG